MQINWYILYTDYQFNTASGGVFKTSTRYIISL